MLTSCYYLTGRVGRWAETLKDVEYGLTYAAVVGRRRLGRQQIAAVHFGGPL